MFQVNKEKLSVTRLPVTGAPQLEDLMSFLKQNSLPAEDIRLEGNHFFLYYDGSRLVGCGGLEFHGDHCLLRSVAVVQELRGKRYGVEIVQDLIERAKSRPLWSISLLTETAPSFFERFGFTKVSREEAPKEIKLSSEFSSVCPVSAVFMSIDLTRRAAL